ncbi:MAG: glycosyltransferase family 9 protein [Fusobacteria bacterium]|nr:glycosyltransferase family 9 protein [Fusobacteriota bacterium]
MKNQYKSFFHKWKEQKKERKLEKLCMEYDVKKVQVDVETVLKNIKSILFLRDDNKIGDMVISTYMYHEIKKQAPYICIDVLAGTNSCKVLEGSPDVNNVHIVDYKDETGKESLIKELKANNYDIVVDFADVMSMRTLEIISKIEAKVNVGFCRGEYKLFDVSFTEKELDVHITERYSQFIEYIGLSKSNVIEYHYYGKEVYDLTLFEKGKKSIVINLFGASKHRTFSGKSAVNLMKLLLEKNNVSIIVLTPKKYQDFVDKIIRKVSNGDVKAVLTTEITDVFGIIKRADVVISPDTSIVHIANLYKKPLVALYRQSCAAKCWGPIYKHDKILIAPGKTDDINAISMRDVVFATDDFEMHGRATNLATTNKSI